MNLSDTLEDTPRISWRALLFAALLPFLVLAPFANKAYTVDDTLSLWVAEQIQTEPLNFFGFDINWYGTADPAYEIIKNPPGLFYLLALFFAIFGWGEIPVHLAMAALASITVAGTYLLANRLSARPLLAALAAGLSPVLLVSSNTVMTDMPMLACYVWAVYLWIRGLDRAKDAPLVYAGVLIGVGTLMKYFCLSAMPLLIAYTLLRTRRLHPSLYYLVIPVFIVGAYVVYGMAAYGVNLLTSAADYAVSYERDRADNTGYDRALVGLIFAGGCVIPALFYAPLLWRPVGLAISAVLALATTLFVFSRERIANFAMFPIIDMQSGPPGESGMEMVFEFNVAVHAALFLFGGIHLLALTLADTYKRRDAESVLLLCWIGGTLVFATMLNWTVNARTILPIAIPVAIVVARRFEDARPWQGAREKLAYAAPAALSLAISAAVLWGDYRWADTQRHAAQEVVKQSAGYGGTYYYKGHWGFQYYMYKHGFPAFDSVREGARLGDRIVVPTNNYTPGEFNPDIARAIHGMNIDIPPTTGVTTMHREAGAGFYTHFWGPLPYRFGKVPAETYWVYQLADFRNVTAAPQATSPARQ